MMSTTLLYNENIKRKKVRQKPVLKFPTSDDKKKKATDPGRETNSKDERRENTNYKLTTKSSYRKVPTKQLKGKKS